MASKVTVIFPDGTKAVRRSPRRYTYVVAGLKTTKWEWREGGKSAWVPCEPRWSAYSWHQGPVNAQKGLAAAQHHPSGCERLHLIPTDLLKPEADCQLDSVGTCMFHHANHDQRG